MEVKEFPQRRKNANSDCCAVEGCESRASTNLGLHFHRFPTPNTRFVNKQNIFGESEKIDMCEAWKINLKINNITKRTKVCSLHFKKSDYFFAGLSVKRFLKRDVVPSCNLPGNKREKENRILNEATLQKRLKQSNASVNVNTTEMYQSQEQVKQEAQEQVICEENSMHQEHDKFQTSMEEPQEESISVESEMLDEIQNHVNDAENQQSNRTLQFPFEAFPKTASPEPSIKHIGVQVNTDCFVPSIIKCISNDSQLNTTTGIESFQILNTIVEMVKKESCDKFEHYNIIMNTKDRIIMTYMKLKQNLSYSFLAVCFSCYTAKHCQRVFYETIKILSKCLKATIQWTPKQEISKNLRKCFQGFERSNQRIKTFKILGSVLPSRLVPLTEDIYIVVCGTINMSAKILSDFKFINVE